MEEAIASERKRHRQSPNDRPTGHHRSFSQIALCSWHDAQGAQQTLFGVRREEGVVRGAGAGAGAVAVLIELTVKSMVFPLGGVRDKRRAKEIPALFTRSLSFVQMAPHASQARKLKMVC